MSVEQMLNVLQEIASTAMLDATKFDRGNKTAGVRVRKVMQEVKKQAQEIRIAISKG